MAVERDYLYHEDIAKGLPELAEKMVEEMWLERQMGHYILKNDLTELSDAGWWNLKTDTEAGHSAILLNRLSSVFLAPDADGRQRSAEVLRQTLNSDTIDVIAANLLA